MSHLFVKRQHDLDYEHAHELMDEVADEMARKLNISYRKQGDTLTFRRPGANGSICLTESEIVIEATLGIMLRTMQPVLENAIERKLDEFI